MRRVRAGIAVVAIRPPTASTADEVLDGLHRQGVLIAYKVETSQRNDLDRGSLDDRRAYFRTEGAQVNVLLYPSPGALRSKAEEDKRLADRELACGSVLVLMEILSAHDMDRRAGEVATSIADALASASGPQCERAQLGGR